MHEQAARMGNFCRKSFEQVTATHSFLFTDCADRAIMTVPMKPMEGKAHR
jgi:hypothetical protein